MQPNYRERRLRRLHSHLITLGLVLLSIVSFTIGAVSLVQRPNIQPIDPGPTPVQTNLTASQTPTPSHIDANITPSPSPSQAADQQATPEPDPPVEPSTTGLQPNELGEVIILEYHIVGDEEGRWSRTHANFRRDLEMLYAQGYRLVSILDYLDNNITLEAGFTPVVITFDDSNRSQFQLVIDPDGDWMADPDTAVGVFEQFIRDHPDFGHSLTFSVLPGADQPNDLFGQADLTDAQLNYLVERGHVLASHTLWHADLSGLSKGEVEEQLGRAQEMIEGWVEGYRLRVLTLPYGGYPEDLEWAKSGVYDGTEYRHDMILKVGANPAPAPNHVDFDPYYTPRVQATQDEIDRVFGRFKQNPEERYVSDGDPKTIAFPNGLRSQLNEATVGELTLRPY